MSGLKRGDAVCDLDGVPEPSTHVGQVEEILPNGHVRVTWKDGTTSERPLRTLGKVTAHGWVFPIPPSVRQEMKDKLLPMTDVDIDAEIARLIGSSMRTDR